MRLRYLALIAFPAAASAQGRPLTIVDSSLVGRILLAEDRRDSVDAALIDGARHTDPRVRTLAVRARGRITDPKFVARDSLPPLASPPHWDEPAWRLRLRALTSASDCGVLRVALADSAWPVRFRALDLLTSACASDETTVSTLRDWIDALPADASRRRTGGVSWHGAAHAAVALARLRPAEAQQRIPRLASHRQPQVRAYAARAAAVLGDSIRLRIMSRDPDDNVKEIAMESLGKLTGHTDDPLYMAALSGRGAQAVRAAAVALKGSPRADARAAAASAYSRWAAEGNASAHDVRAALLEAAGRSATEDHAPPVHAELLPQEVALALGAEIRLRVTMAPTSGGGSFVVRLRGDNAPLMAARILALSRARYYDGLTWQRVEHDFVIQGGSPGANEYVGLSESMRDELGTIPHVRGTVGMSTRGHDTGDAQWFVNLRDNLRLGRDYTVFAEVVEGIDVVDGILEGDVITSIKELPRAR
jgi:cyclophilin family peptidyl-prolyl cis-trans isomerase